MNACMCAVFHYICMYVFTVFKIYVCVPLYSAKDIDDEALSKKAKFGFGFNI